MIHALSQFCCVSLLNIDKLNITGSSEWPLHHRVKSGLVTIQFDWQNDCLGWILHLVFIRLIIPFIRVNFIKQSILWYLLCERFVLIYNKVIHVVKQLIGK
jgi:hypothetical protein